MSVYLNNSKYNFLKTSQNKKLATFRPLSQTIISTHTRRQQTNNEREQATKHRVRKRERANSPPGWRDGGDKQEVDRHEHCVHIRAAPLTFAGAPWLACARRHWSLTWCRGEPHARDCRGIFVVDGTTNWVKDCKDAVHGLRRSWGWESPSCVNVVETTILNLDCYDATKTRT